MYDSSPRGCSDKWELRAANVLLQLEDTGSASIVKALHLVYHKSELEYLFSALFFSETALVKEG